MPVHNGERWLAQALESALAQTFSDFEVVVVDDGSTDGSASVVESFAERDPRVRLVRMAHAGVRCARGVSLVEARGRFVGFLDADDEWLPTRLERQFPYVDERTVVFSDAYLADGDGRIERRYSEWRPVPPLHYPATGLFPHLLALGCFVHIVTVLAPRQLLLDAGAFHALHSSQDTGGTEDYEMWLLLGLRGATFHYLDEPLALYRRHADQITADGWKMMDAEGATLDALMPEARGNDRRLLRQARRHWRKRAEMIHRKHGWRQILAGDTGAARRALGRSLRVRPYSPYAWLALSLTLCPPLARRVVRGRV